MPSCIPSTNSKDLLQLCSINGRKSFMAPRLQHCYITRRDAPGITSNVSSGLSLNSFLTRVTKAAELRHGCGCALHSTVLFDGCSFTFLMQQSCSFIWRWFYFIFLLCYFTYSFCDFINSCTLFKGRWSTGPISNIVTLFITAKIKHHFSPHVTWVCIDHILSLSKLLI